MHIVSVNVSLPREVTAGGRRVSTGIFKETVDGPVRLRALNLDGDRQADLTVHGGPNKAVYVYPVDHYAFWRGEFPEMTLPWGMFGENLTAEWTREDTVNIGDRYRVGSAEVLVTQPRLPCYKLGIKFGREDIVRRFLASGRTGFYLAVAREGTVRAGDKIELIERDRHGVTVADMTRLYADATVERDLLVRAAQVPALPHGWKARVRALDQLTAR
jgi:MOSC domain-containing protein YiiM